MKKVLIPTIIFLILISIGILDAKNFDNFVYYYFKVGPLIYYDLPIWSFFQATGAIVATVAAIIGVYRAYKTWDLERKPTVYATGSFFISKNVITNGDRDKLVNDHQTFQLVNVGRGPAKNVVPSKENDNQGKLLEDSCPHSFVIPSNQGTRQLGEVLKVHGQIFTPGENGSLKFDKENRDIAYFYIYYQDHEGKTYLTEVTVQKVLQADGPIGRKISDDLQLWKVIKNIDLDI